MNVWTWILAVVCINTALLVGSLIVYWADREATKFREIRRRIMGWRS